MRLNPVAVYRVDRSWGSLPLIRSSRPFLNWYSAFSAMLFQYSLLASWIATISSFKIAILAFVLGRCTLRQCLGLIRRDPIKWFAINADRKLDFPSSLRVEECTSSEFCL
jgi:hypothetical protein